MINLKKGTYRSLLGLIIIISIFFSGLFVNSQDVAGVNNVSVTTLVNITNTEPSVYAVSLTPSSVDLSPGGTTQINCTAFVYDVDGWDDVNTSRASFFDMSQGDGSTTDNNYRYINTSCSACTTISSTNASCSCLFNTQYYANNGSWQCNFTVEDRFGLNNTANSSAVTINTVVALDLLSVMDFGNLSVSETSADVEHNVTNYGNVPINISTYGYGSNDEALYNNYSMACQTGNITVGAERYSIYSGTAYNSMTLLSNTSTQIIDFTIPARTNDTDFGKDRNQTYWKIKVPLNVAGNCNGTAVFMALDAS